MLRVRYVLPLLAMLALGEVALAQPPGGGGGNFMANLPPAAQAKIKAWQKWRENHKNFQQLSRTMRAITEMDKDASTQLSKEQAKKILAVVQPWENKPVMTDDQALKVNKDITAALSLPQIKKMAAMSSEWGGGRGGPGGGFGGGGGRPGGGPGGAGGGPGGAGGGRGNWDPSKLPDPKEYNPLNPATYPAGPMNERGKKRVADFMAVLKSRAA